jgi:DNA sulfur modification protein DndB
MTTATATKTKSKRLTKPLNETKSAPKSPPKAPVTEPVATQPKPATYKIPAIRGTQAGQEYYVAMVPAKLLPNLFPKLTNFPTQADIDVRDRFQRELDPARSKAIGRYIVDGMAADQSYTLSAAAASLKAETIEFNGKVGQFGVLEFSAEGELKLLDGQHRIRGLILAAEREAAVQDETISIVIYRHVSVARDQQAFSDMNGKARIPPKSLTMVFDHRDQAVTRTRQTLEGCPPMRRLIDFDRATCPKKSALVFSFKEFHQANEILLMFGPKAPGDQSFAICFWQTVTEYVSTIDDILNRSRHAQTAREISIAPTLLALEAIACQGATLRGGGVNGIQAGLEKLKTFDWAITNSETLEALGGKIRKNSTTIEALRKLIFD